MAVYCVTYDLIGPGRDFTIIENFMSHFTNFRLTRTCWLIDTDLHVQHLRDDLKHRLDEEDRIFVGRLQREWASAHSACDDWLNDPSRHY